MKRAISRMYALAALLSAAPALCFGQGGPGDPRRGHELSVRLCTTCHAVDRQTTGPVRADVPSFSAIAVRPGATAELLAGRIIVPHPAMPGVPLTAAEIRDIVAYIMSLQRTN
jgi:cytochrome c